jgi:vacuolar-type H+-ATPase subunit H
MHEVIQKVIATEAEAKRMVQSAKSEAERILSEAQNRAREITMVAVQDAQVESERILAEAMKATDRDKQTRLAVVAGEIEKQFHLDETAKQLAVAAVVRCVCG